MAKWLEKQYQTSPLGAVVENSMTSGSTVNAPSISAVQNAISNPNLLINSDFRNCYQTTVNQRRLSSYAYAGAKTFTVDRWALSGSEDGKSTLALHSDRITFTKSSGTYTTLVQTFETPLSSEKGFTVSCEVSSGVSLVIGTNPITVYDLVAGVNVINISPNVSFDNIYFYMEANTSVDIKWIKLEQGSIATPLTPQSYGEELFKCQRYYVRYSGTWSEFGWGKSLENKNIKIFFNLPCNMRGSTPTAKFNNGGGLSLVGVSNIFTINSAYVNGNFCVLHTTGSASSVAVGKIDEVAFMENTILEIDAEIY